MFRDNSLNMNNNLQLMFSREPSMFVPNFDDNNDLKQFMYSNLGRGISGIIR